MKAIVIALLFGLMSLPLVAGMPLSYTDFVKIYGTPRGQENMPTMINGKQAFDYNGMTIYVSCSGDSISSIEFTRDSAFSALEIESILKPLSVEEKWKQTGEKDWVLVDTKCKAHWNGESKITVQGS